MSLRPNGVHGDASASPIRGSCPGTCEKRVSGRGSGLAPIIRCRPISKRRACRSTATSTTSRAPGSCAPTSTSHSGVPVATGISLFVSPPARNAADRDSRRDRARLGGWRTASFAAARGNGRVARSDANVARPRLVGERRKRAGSRGKQVHGARLLRLFGPELPGKSGAARKSGRWPMRSRGGGGWGSMRPMPPVSLGPAVLGASRPRGRPRSVGNSGLLSGRPRRLSIVPANCVGRGDRAVREVRLDGFGGGGGRAEHRSRYVPEEHRDTRIARVGVGVQGTCDLRRVHPSAMGRLGPRTQSRGPLERVVVLDRREIRNLRRQRESVRACYAGGHHLDGRSLQ